MGFASYEYEAKIAIHRVLTLNELYGGMKMARPKKVKLRAFKFSCSDIKKGLSSLPNDIYGKASISNVQSRMMPLNEEVVDKDLCCHYMMVNGANNTLFGTMIRLKSSGDVQHLPDTLLNKNSFTLTELEAAGAAGYKVTDHYYYCTNGNHLVTTLRTGTTIKRLETYLNWLLGTNAYSATPVVQVPPGRTLANIESITFQKPFVPVHQTTGTPSRSLFFGEKTIKDFISNLVVEAKSLQDIDIEQIASAQVIFKFKKPRKMTEEEYQKILGAVMKPIADQDEVLFKDKKHGTIKGSVIERSEQIEVDTTDSGVIVEEGLRQGMTRFLSALAD